MTRLRPTESFYLVLIGFFVILFAIFTLFSAGLTIATLFGLSTRQPRWQDLAGGVAFTLLGAAGTWAGVRFYRFVERRGMIHPPGT